MYEIKARVPKELYLWLKDSPIPISRQVRIALYEWKRRRGYIPNRQPMVSEAGDYQEPKSTTETTTEMARGTENITFDTWGDTPGEGNTSNSQSVWPLPWER